MNDEELLMQAIGMQTVYLDGVGAFRKINGVLRCVGYVIGVGAQINLIVSLEGAEAGNKEVRRVLDEKPVKSPDMLERLRMTH
jgi:hypothetical protein